MIEYFTKSTSVDSLSQQAALQMVEFKTVIVEVDSEDMVIEDDTAQNTHRWHSEPRVMLKS